MFWDVLVFFLFFFIFLFFFFNFGTFWDVLKGFELF